MTNRLFRNLLTAFLFAISAAEVANAGVIISPVGATINSGGPGFGSITNTLNQAGLFSGFTSGVTDFDSYIATNPLHTNIFSCCEWFSNSGTTSARVTYDLGAVLTIDRLALWNEEISGIGFLILDAPSFAGFLAVAPADNPSGVYGAQVFSFAPVTTQFVTFNMSHCPQPVPGSFPSCAIGEVAFRTVPEPSTIALIAMALLSLFGFGMMRRRADA